jgi:hypothetical protein
MHHMSMASSMIIKFAGTILVSLVALMLMTIPGPAADQPSPQQRCATGDVQTTTLIEDHGEAGDVLPERLAKAGLTQMEARLACTGGRHADGVALYDEIIRTLGPISSRHTPIGLDRTKAH